MLRCLLTYIGVSLPDRQGLDPGATFVTLEGHAKASGALLPLQVASP